MVTPPDDSSRREARGEARGDGGHALRASTVDRERVLAELSEATARGQIDLGEFDERCAAAWSVGSRADLAALLDDLVVDPMAVVAGTSRRNAGAPPVRRPGSALATSGDARFTGVPGSAWSVAVMSGVDKKGEWACARAHRVVVVMGGALLDLRNAVFESPETVVTVTAVMGGVQILVPEDVRVVEHGFGLMGGFGSARSRSVRLRERDLPPDAPVVRVRGIAVMGGVEVKTVPRRAAGEISAP
ncbi:MULTISPECIES: DUF1707 SHOCT-like domain-containing protein [unclassified Corynebacterium]|uniref:DUF1707 SHOCT-like domain-containing protein n=1 Tax=unclassified Corynebacterium TaxID=2624378 RepID=UPI00264845B2|nr:DUF1707 domain-containing protein [Corynebacterium sp.]MDN5581708.1 DUF1707 domain-containing protein [Corynebacterium sp.]MDN5720406.1 DUF1707 domain-containing protein [Corynebacterium sp.]MDN6258813.1 DUF1707 domain-containing protein [Corynebacterium sp.]